jgi:glycosyltransferase involved in cell wall biosynthesis
VRVLLLNWKDPAQPDAGGAERYVERISRIWAGWGHSVTVLVPRGPLVGRQDVDGVRWVRLGDRHTVFHLARRYLRRTRGSFDLVVESVSTRPFMAHRVVGSAATALYHQVADDVWDQEYGFPLNWLGRRLIEPRWIRHMRGGRVVAVSPSTAQDVARHGVYAVGVVPPGADTPTAPAPRRPSGGARLLFVGRLVRTKRPEDAIAAFDRVRAVLPDASLDIVGDGYMRERLGRPAGGGVTLHGPVSEETKHALIDKADLMLLPATREGFGIVAVEAARRALPVVGYDVGGLRDAVRDGETGVLTAPTPAALADAAVALLGDHERWARYSAGALEWGRPFTWERAARALLALATQEQLAVAAS